MNRVRFRLETSWRVEAAQLIDGLPAFEDLPEELLNDLAGRVRLQDGAARPDGLRQGDRPDAFYVVRSGELTVEDVDAETGDARTLRTLERGDGFGELGLVDRRRVPRRSGRRRTPSCSRWTSPRSIVCWPTRSTRRRSPPRCRVRAGPRAPTVRAPAVGELRRCSSTASGAPIAPAESIMEQGEPGDAFYVDRERARRGGPRRRGHHDLGAGAHFGELALLKDAPRNAQRRDAHARCGRSRWTRTGSTRIVAQDLGSARPDEQRRRDMEH